MMCWSLCGGSADHIRRRICDLFSYGGRSRHCTSQMLVQEFERGWKVRQEGGVRLPCFREWGTTDAEDVARNGTGSSHETISYSAPNRDWPQTAVQVCSCGGTGFAVEQSVSAQEMGAINGQDFATSLHHRLWATSHHEDIIYSEDLVPKLWVLYLLCRVCSCSSVEMFLKLYSKEIQAPLATPYQILIHGHVLNIPSPFYCCYYFGLLSRQEIGDNWFEEYVHSHKELWANASAEKL